MAETPRWMPGFYTPSLTGTEDFRTDGDRLLMFIAIAWPQIPLDDWQRWVIRHILERYPDDWPVERLRGRLRYRQALVSLGRQNGKSVIAAVLGLYALLMHEKTPEVLSVASTVEQANIVYQRVAQVIASNVALAKRLKPTGTRGIKSKSEARPATYFVKTAREEALQGYPATFVVADEVHLLKQTTWTALQLSTSAQLDGLLLGITTAGDENSELLKTLYDYGKSGEDERFFFALWEAPAHLALDDPQFLISANPAIACGRLDLEQEMNALKTMPETQARRYRGNQFVASKGSLFSNTIWQNLPKEALPRTATVFAVDRADNWAYATITASVKHEGKVYTKVVASLTNPNVDRLEELCQVLHRKAPQATFVMEASVLKDLAMRLRERGWRVEYYSATQMMNACATSYAMIAESRVRHAHDMVVSRQMPMAKIKNSGEGWRISRKDSEVDAVIATVLGIHAAESIKERGPALFVA